MFYIKETPIEVQFLISESPRVPRGFMPVTKDAFIDMGGHVPGGFPLIETFFIEGLVGSNTTPGPSAEAGRSIKTNIRRSRETGALAFVVMAEAEMIDDVTIAENDDLFCVWDENWTGRARSIVKEDGVLFRSIHNVGPGQNTKPSETPSMWTRIGAPGDEWPPWSQPLGAHDAYPQCAQVTHNGVRWTSDLDGNVWEPGVFGWTRVL